MHVPQFAARQPDESVTPFFSANSSRLATSGDQNSSLLLAGEGDFHLLAGIRARRGRGGGRP